MLHQAPTGRAMYFAEGLLTYTRSGTHYANTLADAETYRAWLDSYPSWDALLEEFADRNSRDEAERLERQRYSDWPSDPSATMQPGYAWMGARGE